MQIAPPDMLAARSDRLRAMLAARQLDALVVTNLANIAYLSGFFASAAALVTTPEALFLVGDARYSQALVACSQWWPAVRPIEIPAGASYDRVLADTIEPLRGLRVGFEATHMTVSRHRSLVAGLASRGWADPLVAVDELVEQLRVSKDVWEISRLRDGGERLSTVAKYILSKALAGRTESEVAAEVDGELRRVGFERPAFDTIVAAGPNAALPHGRAGHRRIESGDLVVLDCGGVLDGYCTDLSRTITAGPAGSRERRLIELVVEAQAAAFAAVKHGVPPEAVDGAARARLASHGLGDAFIHGTGHGLGLEIHEAPRVTRPHSDRSEPPLGAGMVITLEPGVYFPGWGGVRVEDDVLVTEDGAEWLTDVPRVLLSNR